MKKCATDHGDSLRTLTLPLAQDPVLHCLELLSYIVLSVVLLFVLGGPEGC